MNSTIIDKFFLWVFLLTGLIVWTRSPIFSASLQKLSLKEAIAIALQKNPSLLQLKEEHQAAKFREEAEASGFRPRLTLEAIDKNGPTSAPSFGFSGLVNSTILQQYGVSVVLSQMIYDFGRTFHRTQSKHFEAMALEADREEKKAFVVLNVYEAYATALLMEKLFELAKENKTYWELTEKEAEAKYDAGLTSRVDVDLAKTHLAESKLQIVDAQGNIEKALAELNASMGIDEPEKYSLVDFAESIASETKSSFKSSQEEVEEAFRNRPELHAMEDKIRSEEETYSAAKADSLPALRGLASGGYDNVAVGQTSVNHTYALGVGLFFPFYSGGLFEAHAEEALHQLRAEKAAKDELKQTIRLQVLRARLSLDSLFEEKKVVAEELTHAHDGLNLATERYKEGLSNIVELEQAQVSFLHAKVHAVRLRYDEVVAKASLNYALGLSMEGGL